MSSNFRCCCQCHFAPLGQALYDLCIDCDHKLCSRCDDGLLQNVIADGAPSSHTRLQSASQTISTGVHSSSDEDEASKEYEGLSQEHSDLTSRPTEPGAWWSGVVSASSQALYQASSSLHPSAGPSAARKARKARKPKKPKILCCPYYMFDPDGHSKCAKYRYDSVPRLKTDHLDVEHRDRQTHDSNPDLESVRIPADLKELKNWWKLCSELFPNVTLPALPWPHRPQISQRVRNEYVEFCTKLEALHGDVLEMLAPEVARYVDFLRHKNFQLMGMAFTQENPPELIDALNRNIDWDFDESPLADFVRAKQAALSTVGYIPSLQDETAITNHQSYDQNVVGGQNEFLDTYGNFTSATITSDWPMLSPFGHEEHDFGLPRQETAMSLTTYGCGNSQNSLDMQFFAPAMEIEASDVAAFGSPSACSDAHNIWSSTGLPTAGTEMDDELLRLWPYNDSKVVRPKSN